MWHINWVHFHWFSWLFYWNCRVHWWFVPTFTQMRDKNTSYQYKYFTSINNFLYHTEGWSFKCFWVFSSWNYENPKRKGLESKVLTMSFSICFFIRIYNKLNDCKVSGQECCHNGVNNIQSVSNKSTTILRKIIDNYNHWMLVGK